MARSSNAAGRSVRLLRSMSGFLPALGSEPSLTRRHFRPTRKTLGWSAACASGWTQPGACRRVRVAADAPDEGGMPMARPPGRDQKAPMERLVRLIGPLTKPRSGARLAVLLKVVSADDATDEAR